MKTFSTDGASQDRRLPRALHDGYVLPFEMDFPRMLALLADLSQHFRYPSEDGEHSWADFLRGNEVVATARIIAFDVQTLLEDFEEAVIQGTLAARAKVADLITEIDSWGQEVLPAISEKQAAMLRLAISDFNALPADATESRYRQVFERMVTCLAALQDRAAKYLEHNLTSGEQEPARALLFSYLQLLRRVAENANSFTSRHLDFYYKELLGARPRDNVEDYTYVSFAAQEDVSEVRIPAGTPLLAGKDNHGSDLVYHTKMDMRVNKVWVSSLCTLNLERDRFIAPEHDLGYVTRIQSQKLAYEKQYVQSVPSLPVFGAYLPTDSHDHQHSNDIGFALSSTVLRAAQGTRRFRITMQLGTRFENSSSVQNTLHHLNHPGAAGFADYEQDIGLAQRRVIKLFLEEIRVLRGTSTERHLNTSNQQRLQNQRAALLDALVSSDGNSASTYRDLLLCMVNEAANASEFRTRLGWFLAPYFLGRTHWLSRSIKQQLVEIGARFIDHWRPGELLKSREDGETNLQHLQSTTRVFDDQILRLLLNESTDERDEYVLHFYHLFRKMFKIQLTGENGWHEIINWKLVPARREDLCELNIEFELPSKAAKIIDFDPALHDGAFRTGEPVCKMLINQDSNFFAYSSLAGMSLIRAEIEIAVHGITDAMLQNDTGPLDPSKPFVPFGALPTVDSALVIGTREAAPKQVSQFEFELVWAGLPDYIDGFATYFREYPDAITNDDFKVRLDVLEAGEWQPIDNAPLHSLFGLGGQLQDRTRFVFPVDAATFATTEYEQRPFEFGPDSGSGFFRMVLVAPSQAFGGKSYARTFGEVTAANVKRRFRSRRALPREPFVLTCAKLSTAYVAHAALEVNRATDTERRGKVGFYHIHPFGEIELNSEGATAENLLLPTYSADGNLFIGLVNAAQAPSINLFFDVDDKMIRTTMEGFVAIQWAYLSSRGWLDLPAENILLDSTMSFHRSGIVSLILPQDMASDNPAMPTGQVWLRISAGEKFAKFGKIRQVATQVVEVERAPEAPAGSVKEPRWRLMNNIPGVLQVRQLGVHYGARDVESEEQFRTRVSERLRHKNRALTPWDYERLVLQTFPDVFKVKCLQHTDAERAGQVTVVVVASDPSPDDAGRGTFPRVSAVRLHQIQTFLVQRMPAYAHLRVVNPRVDVLQVRCAVKFQETYRRGEFRETLDLDISRYLWPWLAQGYAASFDWAIRLNDVKQFIKSLPYVDFVTDFSMLRLTEQEQESYRLFDSVTAGLPLIEATTPDSIAAPMEHHFIRIIEDARMVVPEAVGVDELRINRTFVVGTGRDGRYA